MSETIRYSPGSARRGRSSVWVKQSRQERVDIRKKHLNKGVEFFSPIYRQLLEMVTHPENYSLEQRKILFRQNWRSFLEAIERYSGRHPKRKLNAAYAEEFIKNIPEGVAKDMVIVMSNRAVPREMANLKPRIWMEIENYMRARRIPIVPEIVKIVRFTDEAEFDNAELNWKNIERRYIRIMKKRRAKAIQSNELKNELTKIIASTLREQGLHLSANQLIQVRKGVVRGVDEILQKWDAMSSSQKAAWPSVVANGDESNYFVVAFTELVQSVYSNSMATFMRREKGRGKVAARAGSDSVKSGSRGDRMASYAPKESPLDRRSALLSKSFSNTLSARAFNPVAYSIAEMRKESSPTADLLSRLVEKRVISSRSVQSLYIQGSLVQRIFTIAATNPSFTSRFGEGAYEQLARGLTYIGSGGRSIDAARRTMNKDRLPIFEFLEKEGFLETHHGGGSTVYLRRFQSI